MSTPLRERPDAPLGTLIFRAGLLPAETIESALEEGVKTGKRLGEILTERGLIKEVDLARLLAGQKGLEYVTLREQIVDPAAASLFAPDQARLFRALPFALDAGVPVVAIADPTDDVLLRNIREALGREDVRFVVATRGELVEISTDVYSKPLAVPEPEPLPGPEPVAVAEASPEEREEPGPEPSPFLAVPAPELEPLLEASPPETPALNGHSEHPPELLAPEAPAPAVEPAPLATPEPAPAPEPLLAAPEPLAETSEPLLAAPEPLAEASPEPEHALQVPAPAPAPAAAPEPAPAPEPAFAPEPAAAFEPRPAAEEPGRVAAPESALPAPPVGELTVVPDLPAPAPVPEPASAPEPPPLPMPEPVPPPPTPYPPAAFEPVAELATDPDPAPAFDPGPVPAAEPVPQAAAESDTAWSVTLRLANGERVEAGRLADELSARQLARSLMAQVDGDADEWPYVNGRFLKPDTIVSVDIAELEPGDAG